METCNRWVVDGKVYDLTPFLNQHPGGRIFLDFMRGRDSTAQVYTYHPSPSHVLNVLRKYQIGTLPSHYSLAFRPSTKEKEQQQLQHKENSNNNNNNKNNEGVEEMPLPALVPPQFLFPELEGARGFGSAMAVRSVQVNFDSPLLRKVRKRLANPSKRTQLGWADFLFALSTAAIGLGILMLWVYALLLRPSLLSLEGFLWVLAITILRTALAGAGHYYLHQPAYWATQLLEQLFEANYVAVSCVQRDGHTILHHAHTKTSIDSKDLGTTGFVQIPLLYRFPAHTLHKVGQLISGAFLRQCTVYREMYNAHNWLSQRGRHTQPRLHRNGAVENTRAQEATQQPRAWGIKWLHLFTFFLSRIVLWVELLLFLWASLLPLWFAQFVLSLWYNTAVLMANHDYLHPRPLCKTLALHERNRLADAAGGDGGTTPPPPSSSPDWAAEQISFTTDLSVTGLPWLDVWLTAGLGPHRAHHLLPYQHSGYANLVSQAVIEQVCARRALDWLPPTNFWTSALPAFLRDYMLSRALLTPRQMLARGSIDLPDLDGDCHSSLHPTHTYPIYTSFWQEHFSAAAWRKTITHVLEGFTGVAI